MPAIDAGPSGPCLCRTPSLELQDLLERPEAPGSLAGIWARLLREEAQNLLPQGERAARQALQGSRARIRPEGGGSAREAVVPHRGRDREVHVRQGMHRHVLRHRRPPLREGRPEHDGAHQQHVPERLEGLGTVKYLSHFSSRPSVSV